MADTTRGPSKHTSSGGTSAGGAGTAGTRRFEDYRDTYRSDWETRYGTERPWQEHERGYRYGWEAGRDERYRGKQFQDAETDLQSSWSDYASRADRDAGDTMPGRSATGTGAGKDAPGTHRTHSVDAHDSVGGKLNHTWENFKDTVREGFDRARMDR